MLSMALSVISSLSEAWAKGARQLTHCSCASAKCCLNSSHSCTRRHVSIIADLHVSLSAVHSWRLPGRVQDVPSGADSRNVA